MSRIIFSEYVGLASIEVLDDDGAQAAGTDAVPVWLFDRPDILQAMSIIAAKGGSAFLGRSRDHHDTVVDLAAGTVTFEQVEG